MTDQIKKKSNTNDYVFKDGFKYQHDNPYHDRLKAFDGFVLRDNEGEENCGNWAKKEFKNDNPIEVEIGSGYGHFMLEYTQNNHSINFVGLDHRFKRSFQLAKKLDKMEVKNFRYLRARGERLAHLFGESEVSKIFYFFPDPWPKTRHHKKRLFQKTFLDQAYKVLRNDGIFLIKTDHDEYFDWMVDVAQKDERFEVQMQSYDLRSEFPDHFLASFKTKFEKIFLEKGIKIKAMVLKINK
ncbi:MAG: tRNA (guanosine(46)-N7)-methyltransferase TrmB [Bacteriovoracaceae bacterium]|jgi:tRNA (guanine-N7-)-methyltransferase|nr:tRNA (guanosine(46)-N7)-methyltransferase TrmB [Bacteriovoracaceae bacterium]